jgi:hypothetical protein
MADPSDALTDDEQEIALLMVEGLPTRKRSEASPSKPDGPSLSNKLRSS